MSWQKLLEPEINAFIKEHERDDVAELALKKLPDKSWPYPLILDQIKARQKARMKLPRWPDHHKDIVFPAPDILEQASSAATARYKAHLVKGKSFVDLTGGAGVDSCALTEVFESGIVIEHDENAAALIAHNLSLLCRYPVQVHHGRAEDFVRDMDDADLVVADPQRRNKNKKGFYRLEDCSPDIFELLPMLAKKAKRILVKTSPMLDIQEGIKALEIVDAVHVAEWQGECKEVVYILNPAQKTVDQDIPITAAKVNDDGDVIYDFTFTKAEEEQAKVEYAPPQKFLFEPGPAFQKAGGFCLMATRYGIKKLHKHTHLYTSGGPCADFPGRQFEILEVLPVSRASLPVTKAHLSLRNFPGGTEALRKTLRLEEGGDDYLFACTLQDGKKALIRTHKFGENLKHF